MLAFIDPESRIPANHPLRTIKEFADAALAELSPEFDRLYAADGQGRPSIPPERLLKASLPMSLFSVRSERAFCEALDYDLRFRWFLDMDMASRSRRVLVPSTAFRIARNVSSIPCVSTDAEELSRASSAACASVNPTARYSSKVVIG